MKNYLFIASALLLISQSYGATADHVPWCSWPDGHYEANSTDCYGFAQAMAYGRGINHSKCPAASGPIAVDILTDYFEKIYDEPYGLSVQDLENNLMVYDVIELTNHAVYVSAILQTPIESYAHVKVMSKATESTEDEPEEMYLNQIATSANKAQKIWRRSDNWYFKVENDFNDGEIGVKNKNSNWINFQHGSYTVDNNVTFPWEWSVHVNAIEHNERWFGYNRIFKEWETTLDEYPTLENAEDVFKLLNEKSYLVPQVTCNYWRELEFTFCNNFIGISTLGKMEIDEDIVNNISSSQIFTKREELSFNFSAIDQYYNGIIYNFSNWNDGSYTKFRTTPDDHSYDFVANFNGKPLQVQNVSETGQVNMPIHLVWDQHINSNVSYKIYRKSRDQYGNETGPDNIASLPHGTTSYTDYDFMKTSSYNILIHYDVRAYYSVENTSADTQWYAVFGLHFLKDKLDSLKIGNDLADEILNIFPNPANPTTSINLNIKESGNVTLSIFDINGKLIKKIFKGQIATGNHRYIWNGHNDYGNMVSTGVYFAIIATPSELFRRKIILLR